MSSISGISVRTAGRVAVAALLIVLALMGSTGVAVANEHTNPGRACPPPDGENPTKAYEQFEEDDPGVVRSFDGRMTALSANGCSS